MQYNNIKDSFAIGGFVLNKPVLLIDDMVDSRWTLTVAGILLKMNGSGDVYPFALRATTKGM